MTNNKAASLVNEQNEKAVAEMNGTIESLHQADKIFIKNQLGSLDDLGPFMPMIALWKKRGGGSVEWQFVLNMTDEAISEELGFDTANLEEIAAAADEV